MKELAFIYLIGWLFIAGCWIGNLVKLMGCDFESSYKEEIIHGIGLVPVVSVVTVWYDKKED